jgi:hypothetical protein
MGSLSFDTYLILTDGSGRIVASNDDTFGTDAWIQNVRLPSAGVYTIEATAFSGGRGPYSSTIQ